jgi:hypothetical protein
MSWIRSVNHVSGLDNGVLGGRECDWDPARSASARQADILCLDPHVCFGPGGDITQSALTSGPLEPSRNDTEKPTSIRAPREAPFQGSPAAASCRVGALVAPCCSTERTSPTDHSPVWQGGPKSANLLGIWCPNMEVCHDPREASFEKKALNESLAGMGGRRDVLGDGGWRIGDGRCSGGEGIVASYASGDHPR